MAYSSSNILNIPIAMKIHVSTLTGKVYSFECKSTDTIAHLKAAVHAAEGIPPHKQRLLFDHAQLGGTFQENMTLAEACLPEICLLHLSSLPNGGGGVNERPLPPPPRHEKNYLYYANAFKSGWREEHAKLLLHSLLKLCQHGFIFEGKVTDDLWLTINYGLENSTVCSFGIDFLKQRLSDYKQLYSLIAETTSPIFRWDREKKTIHILNSNWWEYHPELLLLCGAYISYFDSLEEVCLLLRATTF